MNRFQLRTDLDRAVIGGFALPLGIQPGDLPPPVQGFTIAYNPGRDEEPDTYTFQVVVSHERVAPIVRRAFDLLPSKVTPIVEVNSTDAYRSLDVYIGREDEPVPLEEFLRTWGEFEPILLEDGGLGIGANSEDPFVEIFLDQWKVLTIHVPLSMRDDVETMLREFDLDEVPQTWPAAETDHLTDSMIRPIFNMSDEEALGFDDLLLELRHRWSMELNVDPDRNLDEGGRELGMTLWNAVVIARDANGDPDRGAYVSVWASARSMTQMQRIIDRVLLKHPEWVYSETYAIDRVAFDERPDELRDLAPRRDRAGVHHVKIEPWTSPSEAEGHE